MRRRPPRVPEFQQLQRQLTAHLRDPSSPPPDGIEERRLKIYRELFYNNVEGFLANAFPVLRRLIADAPWQAMVRDFYARHESHDPLFHGLAEEFLRYLDDERGAIEGDPAFLHELAHYEWVELALSIAEDETGLPGIDAEGDLLEGAPVLSPLAWTLVYDYPVHRIGPEFQPAAPGGTQTCLVVHRDAQDAIRFIEIDALTASLLDGIEREPALSGREQLLRLAEAVGSPAPPVIDAGHAMLKGLRQRGVVLGTRRES